MKSHPIRRQGISLRRRGAKRVRARFFRLVRQFKESSSAARCEHLREQLASIIFDD